MARGRDDYTDYIAPNGLRYCVEATSDSQREWKIYTLAPGSRAVQPCELEVYGKPVPEPLMWYLFALAYIALGGLCVGLVYHVRLD